MSQPVRVRFAPSPTGDPHVGGIRTALFNWLFARHHGGKFIFRIEDTDRERLVPGSQERLIESLRWLGLDFDEGPSVGGSYGPYVQSERLELYRTQAQTLLDRGRAYECYCSPERLEQLRREQQARHAPSHYDRTCRYLSAGERRQRREAATATIIRLRVPANGSLKFTDHIRGELTFALATIDDTVLLKSDGYPTYHLANVVDDHLMAVSHVIRGEEWLPSTPKHILLYEGFGWPPPEFAHLPLLFGRDRSKLSKRHGAVSFHSFIDRGYLPEAMLNFLALLGWNPGGDQELYNPQELIQLFSLNRVQSSGAIFDTAKLDWMNLQYLKRLSDEDFGRRACEFVGRRNASARELSPARMQALVSALRDRIKRFDEATELLDFVFRDVTVDAALLVPKQSTPADARAGLLTAEHELERIPGGEWNLSSVKTALALATRAGESRRVLWPVRVAITGKRASPPVFESVALLTKSEALRRIRAAREALTT